MLRHQYLLIHNYQPLLEGLLMLIPHKHFLDSFLPVLLEHFEFVE
jgi:hypothetical protein